MGKLVMDCMCQHWTLEYIDIRKRLSFLADEACTILSSTITTIRQSKNFVVRLCGAPVRVKSMFFRRTQPRSKHHNIISCCNSMAMQVYRNGTISCASSFQYCRYVSRFDCMVYLANDSDRTALRLTDLPVLSYLRFSIVRESRDYGMVPYQIASHFLGLTFLRHHPQFKRDLATYLIRGRRPP